MINLKNLRCWNKSEYNKYVYTRIFIIKQTKTFSFNFQYIHKRFLVYTQFFFLFTVASDCLDERFVFFNGSCYLFVFYPEVDWFTAQNACRGISTQLASISTKEEEHFIVNSFRNNLDFSPQVLYWIGGELTDSGNFEWVDGIQMKLLVYFKNELSRRYGKINNCTLQGIASAKTSSDKMPDPICLGLHTKASLGAGLHLTARSCSTIGGYVCKRQVTDNKESAIQNLTITDSYGRLTSPGTQN